MQKNIAIVGGGLVGSLLAVYMIKRGHKVSVYERRPDMRKAGYIGGRSINLAISDRGWRALEKVGLANEIHKIAIPMYGRYIHNTDGTNTFLPYGKDGQAIFSLSRGELNKRLVMAAEKEGAVFYFDEKIESIDFEKNTFVTENTVSGNKQTISADLIFGADGAFSAVRSEMQKNPMYNYSQTYESYGYKELEIPAGPNNTFLTEKNALHIWPRKNFMMIALPNTEGTFTVTLFAPFEGAEGFDSLQTKEAVQTYFEKYFPSAIPLMPNYLDDFFTHPTSYLMTVRCYPWIKNNTILIGDAAHGIVPFYGQGMNCGFEDVRILDHIIDDNGENWDAIKDAYQKSRKSNADAIAQLALNNYIEMRDLSAQPEFQLRMKIDKHIAAHFSEKYHTLYSMVSFSHTPYSEAMARSEKQAALLDKIMLQNDIASKWESPEILAIAAEWIKENL